MAGMRRVPKNVPSFEEHIAKIAHEHADDVVVDDEDDTPADENASAA